MRLIDANELRDRLQSLSYDDWNQGVSTSLAEAYSRIADMVDEMPTIDAEPRETGYWLPYEFGDYHWHKCSICGQADKYIETIGDVNVKFMRYYCPYCGANMEKE